ncbi:MAG: DUF4422 domain-containing protein [Lachnospiraceae bacterium]|nr:DUF4422 domain-containing protein [Lachnospiraceae bacterium]
MYYYAEEIINRIKNSDEIAIFGAGIMSLGVISCLTNVPYQLSIRCCLVSDKKKNPACVLGIPVLDFTEAEAVLSKRALVLVAAMDKHRESMEHSVSQHGYRNFISLTYEGDLWSLIRGNTYIEMKRLQKKTYRILEEELDLFHEQNIGQTFAGLILEKPWQKRIKLYTVRSHADKKLQEDLSKYFWEIPIQAGAELTEQQVCEIRDNCGEHISYKNRQYCELTALYWIWKNDNSSFVGLGHYRRHFELNETIIEQLLVSDIDVVLTIPIFDYPSVKEVYFRDHVKEDWEVMMEAIHKYCPEYSGIAEQMQDGRFYYAYNMFIMRREILEEYCAWLFPILFYCETYCKEKEDVYQNRYIGFLAEHLMSIYFMFHEDKYKIVHVTKHFIER